MAQTMSISEIDAAVAHVAPDRRAHMLGQVTDLFVLHAPSFSDDEIALFDDVIEPSRGGYRGRRRGSFSPNALRSCRRRRAT